MDRFEKLEQLMADEAFVKEVLELETAEAVQTFLMGKGVELSIEEIKVWGEAIREAMAGGELNEETLDNVAGGYIRPWMPRLPLPIGPFPRLPKGWPRWW